MTKSSERKSNIIIGGRKRTGLPGTVTLFFILIEEYVCYSFLSLITT